MLGSFGSRSTKSSVTYRFDGGDALTPTFRRLLVDIAGIAGRTGQPCRPMMRNAFCPAGLPKPRTVGRPLPFAVRNERTWTNRVLGEPAWSAEPSVYFDVVRCTAGPTESTDTRHLLGASARQVIA